MTQRKTWTRWFRIWGPKRPKLRSADDFADHGTAFGLDLSLAAAARDPWPATSAAGPMTQPVPPEPPRYGSPA